MGQNILIKLLESLSFEETKKFRKFLSSPYFNTKKFILNFYDKVVIYYPDYSESNFSLEKIKTEMNINENTFRSIQSKLTKSLYDFMIFENINKNDLNRMNHLFSELICRNLFDIFRTRMKRFEIYELPSIKKDSLYFFNVFLLNSYKANNDILSKMITSKKNIVATIINDIDSCYQFFLVFIITLSISDYIKYIILNIDYGININDTILNKMLKKYDIESIYELIKNNKELSTYLFTYIKLFECFIDFSNVKKYDEYKKSFFKSIYGMNEDERNFHLSNLINLCLLPKRTNELDLLYKNKVFKIYKMMLKNGYYKDSKNKYLSLTLFRNILITSVILKEYEWIEEFLITYSKKVTPDQTKNMLNYGLAYFYNAKREYKKSLEYIYQIKIDRFIYKYDVREMNLKIFFEMNVMEKVLELLHNYKDFIRKNEFATKNRRLFRGNFIKFLEKLTLLRCGDKKIDAGYLRKLILQVKHVSNRNWLLEKANEILEKKQIKPYLINQFSVK